MSKKKRSYSVYLGGELFSIKQLVGNAWLAEAIYEKSHGRFRCLLPQDFSEVRGRSARAIRDHNLRALAASDLALFDFEGADLDSGTVVEFLFAKAADIPAVLMRSDIRNGREQHRQPWNIMASHFPRTLSVLEPSLPAYHASLASRRRGIDPALHLAGQHSSAAGQLVCDAIAAHCVRAFERLLAMEPALPRHLREEMYQWLPLMAGIGGKEKALRKEFEHYLERKVERDLL